MPNPLGYYFYLRDNIDGLLPAPRGPAPKPIDADRGRRQTLGLLLMSAAICVPIVVTCVIAVALKLLN